MNFTTCLIVMFGGALGTLMRYLVSLFALPISSQLPWGTIIVNITGSFIIGLFGTLTLAHGRFPVSEEFRLFVMIGICGGYTTFSSFSLQTLDLTALLPRLLLPTITLLTHHAHGKRLIVEIHA